MGTFNVVANVIVVTPPSRMRAIFEQVVPGFDEDNRCAAGASRLPGDAGLAYKVLGMGTGSVKAKVREFWELVRREVTGARVVTSGLATRQHAGPPSPPLLSTLCTSTVLLAVSRASTPEPQSQRR